MPSFPKNPYRADTPAGSMTYIHAGVSSIDLAYFHSIFRLRKGLLDVLLSTLFRSFIHELRNTHALTSTNDAHVCWHTDHATLALFLELIGGVSYRGVVGEAGSRDVEPGTCGLHQDDGNNAQQCADTEGRTCEGGHSPRRGEKDEKAVEEEQPGLGDGPVESTKLLEFLRTLQ